MRNTDDTKCLMGPTVSMRNTDETKCLMRNTDETLKHRETPENTENQKFVELHYPNLKPRPHRGGARKKHLQKNSSPTATTAESSYQWLAPLSKCHRMPTQLQSSALLFKQANTAPVTGHNRQRSEACSGGASTGPGE